MDCVTVVVVVFGVFFDYYFFHKLSILLDVFGSEWEHGKHILVAFFCCYFFLLLFSIDFFPFFITTSNLFVYTVEDFLVSFIQHGLHSFQIFAFFSFHFFLLYFDLGISFFFLILFHLLFDFEIPFRYIQYYMYDLNIYNKESM